MRIEEEGAGAELRSTSSRGHWSACFSWKVDGTDRCIDAAGPHLAAEHAASSSADPATLLDERVVLILKREAPESSC